jgi:hypothetical protein
MRERTMKKALAAIVLFAVLACVTIAFAAEDSSEYYADNLYITSYYTVEVYNNNRKVGFLYAGTRAKILKSTEYWLYVEFWDGRRTVTGWIRR